MEGIQYAQGSRLHPRAKNSQSVGCSSTRRLL
jgi:hypothetical protein